MGQRQLDRNISIRDAAFLFADLFVAPFSRGWGLPPKKIPSRTLRFIGSRYRVRNSKREITPFNFPLRMSRRRQTAFDKPKGDRK
jgi:hypothetical protein